MGTVKQRPAGLPVSLSPSAMDEGASTPQAGKQMTGFPLDVPLSAPQPTPSVTVSEALQDRFSPTTATLPAGLSISPNHRFSLNVPPILSPSKTVTGMSADEDEVDTDEEDEFFDAIESGQLPNLVVNESLVPGHEGHHELPKSIDQEQYVGYRELRKKLAMNSDNRPPTSLWSVLKVSL